MAKAVIEIQDEVNVRLKRVDSDTLSLAQNELTYFVPGFNFMPSFKLGRWDGKIRLLQLTGKTYLNLLDDILPILEHAGYDFEIVDHRHDYSDIVDQIELIDEYLFKDYEINGSPVILRDYQVEAVNTALSEGSGVLELSTGGGKTITCAAI